MIAEEERQRRLAERERRNRVIAMAYKRVFSSEDGKLVLMDLVDAFGIDHPEFLPSATRPGEPIHYDTHYAAIRSGQRSVYLHINKKMAVPNTPDGNVMDAIKVAVTEMS